MNELILLARRGDMNEWLDQHPMVLGLMFLTIGVAVGCWGWYELSTGTAYTRYGKAFTGKWAKISSILTIVMGCGCSLLGLYKIVFG